MSALVLSARPVEPYRGAEAFRFVDRHIFLARQLETRLLMQKLTIYRAGVLYGESGAGKSSLVNAGLIPEAMERGFTVDRVLVQPAKGAEIIIERIPLGEKGPPFLEGSLVESEPANRIELSVADFERKAAQVGRSHLLIFDQFEEIVTRFPESQEELRTSIVDMLLRLFYSHGVKAKLLLVFREDYLARVANLLAFAPEWIAQSVWLRALPKKADLALEIIRAPFEVENVSPPFDQRFSTETMKTLAEQLTAVREPEGLSLTDLQIACLELWRAENPDRLLGEVQATGLIKRYLDHALGQLESDRLNDAAVALLSLMVTPAGTRNVISEADAISRVRDSDPHFAQDDLTRALAALEKVRLIRRESQHNENYYEVVSEFLVPWITALRRQRETEALRHRAAQQIQSSKKQVLVSALLLVSLVVGIMVYVILNAQKLNLTHQLTETQQTVSQLKQDKGKADLALGWLVTSQSRRPDQKGTRMPGLNIGEMAFGILLVYLLVSILSSVLTEIIGAFRDEKAGNLRRSVDELFFSGDFGSSFSKAFWDHPLILSLTPPRTKSSRRPKAPSYIPPETFSLAVSDLLAPGMSGEISAILAGVNELTDSQLRRTLSIFATQSKEVSQFRESVASWFVAAMQASSAAYKKLVQVRLLAIAFALTILLNADTLGMANRLLQAPIQQAETLVQIQTQVDQTIKSTPPPPMSGDEVAHQTATARNVAEVVQEIIANSGVGTYIQMWKVRHMSEILSIIQSNFFGWCITALVAFFGASLGYDLARWMRSLAFRKVRIFSKSDSGATYV